MKNSFSCILVTYQPQEAALSHILDVFAGKNLFIIDNTEYKKNDIPQWVKKIDTKSATYVHNDKNIGYAGAVNKGIQMVSAHCADWIIIINQDLHITKKALDEFSTTLDRCLQGIAGPFAGRLDSKRWTTILPQIKHAPQRLEKKTDYISGSCIAIHKIVFEGIGNFYEPYFMYYEDVDFCVRAKRAGFPLIHVPIGGIAHPETTSLHRGSFLHKYYLARNHLLFVRRLAPIPVKIREIMRLPRTLWEHHKKQEDGALLGIRDYWFGHFGRVKRIV